LLSDEYTLDARDFRFLSGVDKVFMGLVIHVIGEAYDTCRKDNNISY